MRARNPVTILLGPFSISMLLRSYAKRAVFQPSQSPNATLYSVQLSTGLSIYQYRFKLVFWQREIPRDQTIVKSCILKIWSSLRSFEPEVFMKAINTSLKRYWYILVLHLGYPDSPKISKHDL